jgi:hypothetical protein
MRDPYTGRVIRSLGAPPDPEVVAALQNQLADLKRRGPKGQAGPDWQKQVLELEASIEALQTGQPHEVVLARKKSSNVVRNVVLGGLALYGVTIAARFFRR